MKKNLIITIATIFIGSPLFSQGLSDDIRLNQVGFYPFARKIAVVVLAQQPDSFYVTTRSGKKVFSGRLSEKRNAETSGKFTRIADFTPLTTPGEYLIQIPSTGYSYSFAVKPHVHEDVAKAILKSFYFQRASIKLEPVFAGKWAREAGHLDTSVFIHASAASSMYPEATTISSPGGWYDAGDYNKYIVNSGFTVGTLLSLYEDFPEFFARQKLNIPESGNNIPDILDEILWNVRWMLTMQDRYDGGVFHKLTDSTFANTNTIPSKAVQPRFVVQKSTAATLDFAASMAQAARIFRQFKHALPGLSDSCLNAAVKAWNWARKNPAIYFHTDSLNKYYRPKILTGPYDDTHLKDEFIWAATELYFTTRADSFYNAPGITIRPADFRRDMTVPQWRHVQVMAYKTIIRFQKSLQKKYTKAAGDYSLIKEYMLRLCDTLSNNLEARSFATVMGRTARDFNWGSNGVAASQGIVLLYGYQLTGNTRYLKYALTNADYILGRNGTGYCFITGFGSKQVMNPHHRPSRYDNIPEPVPGLMPGGPNPFAPKREPFCSFPSTLPNEAYTDKTCSAASNENSINISASAAYLFNALEFYQDKLAELVNSR